MNNLSRKELFGLAGNAFILLSCGAAFAVNSRPARAQMTEVTSAPDVSVSPSNPGSINRQKLVEALSNSNRNINFPAGDYRLDNSSNGVTIAGYSGQMTMEEGARFIFEDKTQRGLVFNDGTGARFSGIRSTFSDGLPSTRGTSAACWLFQNTTGTYVEDADVDGSAGAGLLFWRCNSPRVNRARVRNTMADGLHFANCQDGRVSALVTYNTGDDGLAFVNYASGPENTGGYATNIVVERSRARGIAVVGQSDVAIDGFKIDATAVSGLYVAQENSFNTRVPHNVSVSNGQVSNAGRIEGYPGSRHGISYENVGSVSFMNINVVAPGARGVYGVARSFVRDLPSGSTVQEQAGTVTLHNVGVFKTPDAGFDLQGGTLYLYDLSSKETGRTGFYIADTKFVKYGKLVANEASMRSDDTLARGFSFEQNARIAGTELWVVDGKTTPTCFVVNTYGRQSGDLGKLIDRVAARKIKLVNDSRLALSK